MVPFLLHSSTPDPEDASFAPPPSDPDPEASFESDPESDAAYPASEGSASDPEAPPGDRVDDALAPPDIVPDAPEGFGAWQTSSSEPESHVESSGVDETGARETGDEADRPPPTGRVELVPVRTAPPDGRPFPLARVVIGFLIVFLLGLASMWMLDSVSEQNVSGDLIQFASRADDAINQFQESTDPESVGDQLLRRLGWRVQIPDIDKTPLTGVGFADVMPGISVPVLMYEEPSGGDLAVTIVNYVFLDTHEGILSFENEALRGIEEEGSFVVRKGRDQDVLIWRSGDEIFLASGEETGEILAPRVAR